MGASGTQVGFGQENANSLVSLNVADGKGELGYALHFKASEHGNFDSIKVGRCSCAVKHSPSARLSSLKLRREQPHPEC